MKTTDLEDRIIDFAVDITDIAEHDKSSYAGNYYGNQLIQSSGSPTLNYGEVRRAKSHKDFVHKMGICIKELRESFNCLRIIKKANQFLGNEEQINMAINENNQLISIFVAGIKTSKNNNSNVKNR